MTNACEKTRFTAAVAGARSEWDSRRRRLSPFLGEDFRTIAALLLEESFWPFTEKPQCVNVIDCPAFPCVVEFGDDNRIPLPRSCNSLWEFLHQLAHWCLPLEGHNQHFSSFYASLVEQTYGVRASRILCTAYEDHGVSYLPDWLGPLSIRHDYLHPFVAKTRDGPALARPELLSVNAA